MRDPDDYNIRTYILAVQVTVEDPYSAEGYQARDVFKRDLTRWVDSHASAMIVSGHRIADVNVTYEGDRFGSACDGTPVREALR